MTNNHSLAVTYNRLRWNSPAGVQTAATVANGVESWGNDGVNDDWVIGRFNSVLGSRVTNEVTFQWGRDFEFQSSQDPVPGEPVASGTNRSPNVGDHRPAAFLRQAELPRTHVLSGRTPDSGRRHGHGRLAARTRSRSAATSIACHDTLDNLFQEGGVYAYGSRVDFISDYELNAETEQRRRAYYSSFSQGVGPTAFSFETVDYAAFVQDTWHVQATAHAQPGPALGIRADAHPQIANPLEPRTSVFPSDKNNWGPRVGDHLGRDAARATPSSVAGTGCSTAASSTRRFRTPSRTREWRRVSCRSQCSTTQAGAPMLPNILASASASPSRPDVVFFEPNMQNPMIHQYDLILEQKIRANTMVSVSYVGSQGATCRSSSTRTCPLRRHDDLRRERRPVRRPGLPRSHLHGARPNANFGHITPITRRGLDVQRTGAPAEPPASPDGLQFQASYTDSRATDNGQRSQTFTTGNNVLNPFDLGLEEIAVSLRCPAPLQLQRGLAAEGLLDVAGRTSPSPPSSACRPARCSTRFSAATRRFRGAS